MYSPTVLYTNIFFSSNASRYIFIFIMLTTSPMEIAFLQFNMKCSGENLILRRIFHLVSCFPLHFMLYLGNLGYFSDSVCTPTISLPASQCTPSLNFSNVHQLLIVPLYANSLSFRCTIYLPSEHQLLVYFQCC